MDLKEDIRSRLSIEDVVGQYVELKRAGRNYKGLSPFAPEKTPSFIVSPERGIWHDFSSGKGGDMFTFIMEVEGVDFRQAIESLARRAGIDTSVYNTGAKRTDNGLKNKLLQVNASAALFFQKNLVANQKALEYLFKSRKLNKKIVQQFKLGYAPNTYRGLVEFLLKKGFTEDEMVKAGVAVKGPRGLIDIFRGRVTIPLFNYEGEVVGFTARELLSNGRGPKYLNSPQTLIYNKSDLIFALNFAKDSARKLGNLILTEGNMDAIASHQAEVFNVVAASGTAFTAKQLKRVAGLVSKIVLCLDSDRAGLQAAERIMQVIAPSDLLLDVIVIPPPYKDPDEYIQGQGAAAWQLLALSSKDAYIWFIDQHTPSNLTPSAKGQVARQILAILNLIKDPVAKSGYLDYLASRLEVRIESLNQLASISVKAPILKKATTITTQATRAEKLLFSMSLEIFSLLLKNPNFLDLKFRGQVNQGLFDKHIFQKYLPIFNNEAPDEEVVGELDLIYESIQNNILIEGTEENYYKKISRRALLEIYKIKRYNITKLLREGDHNTQQLLQEKKSLDQKISKLSKIMLKYV